MAMLLQAYHSTCQAKGFRPDADQEVAVQHLQRVTAALAVQMAKKQHAWFKRRKRQPVMGLYMWGGVGRGKTFLMDLFFAQLPFPQKLRIHFNRFMQKIHQELKALEGHAEPLLLIAKRWAKQYHIICFDEFLVIDIADAMVLGVLFQYLFAEGVSLVATSNVQPDRLYEDGLQRDRFLPAIAVINQHVEVLNVDSGVDHRQRPLTLELRYYTPLKGEHDFMQTHFDLLAAQQTCSEAVLQIAGRAIAVVKRAQSVVWFEFAELCQAPRGQADYIALAEAFDTVLVSHVPQLHAAMDDYARRFISLVDEFYDSQVVLVLSATVPIEDLYVGEQLAFEFRRTRSRLQEMQSQEYSTGLHTRSST